MSRSSGLPLVLVKPASCGTATPRAAAPGRRALWRESRGGIGWRPLLALLPLAPLLGACATPSPQATASRLQVVTTALPLTLLSRAVAGDCAEVQALIPEGLDPHDVQARPADLLLLRRARVLVRNGLGLDDYVKPWITSAAPPDLRVVDTSQGVAALPSAAGDAEADAPSRDNDHDHDQDPGGHSPVEPDQHGTKDQHRHSHGPLNPHIWLDPQRAEQQLNSIRDALVQVDPGCAATYRRNASAYGQQLRALDRQIAAELAPYRGRTLVTHHDVLPYFAQRYGLQAAALVEQPDQPPTPADLQRISRLARQQGLRALLSEPPRPSRSLEALARDLGLRVLSFDPLETAPAAAAADPDTYLRVMRSNAATVRQAFAGP